MFSFDQKLKRHVIRGAIGFSFVAKTIWWCIFIDGHAFNHINLKKKYKMIILYHMQFIMRVISQPTGVITMVLDGAFWTWGIPKTKAFYTKVV
jgi:hypothetical protein